MPQMPRPFLLTTAVMACLCAQGAFAQSLPSRPGLWAEATEVKINGNAMPSGLDDLDESMRSSIAQAMRKLGLPAGWSPRMSCRTPADLNLQNWLAKAAKDCGNLSSKLSGNKLSVWHMQPGRIGRATQRFGAVQWRQRNGLPGSCRNHLPRQTGGL